MAQCRMGEATNPGPPSLDVAIGTINVAGMSNRAHELVDFPCGIWTVTETQLTEHGQKVMLGTMRMAAREQSRNLRCKFGYPAPSRVQDSDAGSWTGVCTLADWPLQMMNVDWPGAVFVSARTMITRTYIGNTPVVGAAVYGAAKSPTFRDPVAVTRQILQVLTKEVVDGARGCRYISGDFNLSLFEVAELDYWYQKGWRELQHFAWTTTGKPVEATCKSSTVRDYVWASPELLCHLQRVEVLHHCMPDHSAVVGHFSFDYSLPSNVFWPMAQRVQWDSVRVPQWHQQVQENYAPFAWTLDSTKDFDLWSRRVETSLHGHHAGCDSLPRHTHGRGQHLKVVSLPAAPLKIKEARHGEEVQRSSFLSKMVNQWYKQLRRLQALQHSAKAGGFTVHKNLYQIQCWHAICKAAGFKHGFCRWWSQRAYKLQGAPSSISFNLPSSASIILIFEDFKMNYRHFEQWHLMKRGALATARWEQFQKDFFKQLRKEPPAAIDLLEKIDETRIVSTGPEADEVDVMPPIPWSTGRFYINDDLVEVTCPDPAVPTHLVIDTDRLLFTGLTLKRVSTLTQTHDIQDELRQLWEPRWNLLESIPLEAWGRVMAFTRDFLPRLAIPYVPPTPSSLRMVLKKGKGLKTRGPDSWDRDDIQNLPELFLGDMASLYSKIEKGLDWPVQLVRGHVHCLAKTSQATLATQYRPVTLFSLWYRLWSSLRTRHLLDQLSSAAPDTAFGYLPHRSCNGITYLVQSLVEIAASQNESLSGVLVDITRCFNHLPRMPLLYTAEHLGVPGPIIVAWKGFLRLMQRAFCVRNSPSCTIASNSGMPEGDGLSCVAMLVATFSFHHYMQVFCPNIRHLSFVDNLELVAASPGLLQTGFVVLESWCEMMGLSIDQHKTQFWAVQLEDRKMLQQLGRSIIVAGKDLGVSMIYGTRHRNLVLQERIQGVFPHWHRLRQMKVSIWHKLQAIHIALLPRSLHGIEHTVLGWHWIRKLRTKALRALRMDRAGAAPSVRLALLLPMHTDPGYFAAWCSLRIFVVMLQNTSALQLSWRRYFDGNMGKRTFGPFAQILLLAERLQWFIDEDLVLYADGEWKASLLTIDLHHLQLILRQAWTQHVAQEVSHRKDFLSLDGIDLLASHHKHADLDHASRELLACVMDGTFHLGTTKAKYDPSQTGHCSCGELDTLEHRALHCCHFQHVREQFPECVAQWHSFPQHLTHHGWAPANPHLWHYWAHLQEFQLTEADWCVQPCGQNVQHLFTDGTCQDNGTYELALAAFAIIHENTGKCLTAALLPSSYQSIDRAELVAVLESIRWGFHYSVYICIWTDSAYAFWGLKRMVELECIPRHWANQDLWDLLFSYLAYIRIFVKIQKTVAHRSLAACATEQERWETRWNSAADSAAKLARMTGGPAHFRSLYVALHRAHQWHSYWSFKFQRFLLALAHCSLRLSEAVEGDAGTDFDFVFAEATPNSGEVSDLLPLAFFPVLARDTFLSHFGVSHAEVLVQFMLRLDREVTHLVAVSYLELFVAFDLLTSHDLPIHVASSWLDFRDVPAGELLTRTLASKLRVFVQLFKAFCSVFAFEFDSGDVVRPSSGVPKKLAGVLIPWPEEVNTLVKERLRAFTLTRLIRRANDLARPWS